MQAPPESSVKRKQLYCDRAVWYTGLRLASLSVPWEQVLSRGDRRGTDEVASRHKNDWQRARVHGVWFCVIFFMFFILFMLPVFCVFCPVVLFLPFPTAGD